MSVVEPSRIPGKMAVHVKAELLASYTSTILANAKTFNPKVDEKLIDRMRKCAIDIYVKSWQANKINATTNRIDRELRYRLQEEAILLCDELYACIWVAKSVFHLRHKRMKYWSELIFTVRTLLQAWKESDIARYGQP